MSEDADFSKIKELIWITTKSRIYAERRFRSYDIASHIVLSLLSVVIISITLLSEELPQSAPLDAYTVVYSVFILAASIVVFGFKFGETATLHRECYLRLQRLHDSTDTHDKVLERYHCILSSYPNHSDCDYESLVISRTLLNSEIMSRSDGTSILWSYPMLFRWAVHHLSFWLLPCVILVTSIGSIFWIW